MCERKDWGDDQYGQVFPTGEPKGKSVRLTHYGSAQPVEK
jgi:hypothetical protein